MGWKEAFSYTRSLAARQGVGESARADEALPLGARIGSVVQLQVSPLVRTQAAGSLIAMPGAGDTLVLAVSQVRLEPEVGFYRLYLATGDARADEKFVQVFTGDDGSVAELLYCSQLARIVPETAEDQDAFTGAAGYGLGESNYTLWREQLAGMVDESALAGAFGDSDSLVFARDAGAAGEPFVAPFTGHETRIDDVAGRRGVRQELYFMPYVRQLAGGGREYLLITTEIIESVDGDSSKRGIHVDFVIGVPIEQERISVQ